MRDNMLQFRSKKSTIEEIEKEDLEYIINENIANGNKRIPEVVFGFANKSWEEFKTKVKEDDELWYSEHHWGPLNGWGGWLLVRRDENNQEFVAAQITCWVS